MTAEPDSKFQKAAVLRRLIKDLEGQLYKAKVDLEALSKYCQHTFGEPERLCTRVYDMETNIYWRRICSLCGLEQSTTKTRAETVDVPIFPNRV